jgi:sugar phosphate isomerase/epimerase
MTDLYPLAFSTLGCPQWSLEQAAAQAAAHGYRALELRLLNGELIEVAMPIGRRRQILETMQRHKLEVVGLGSSIRFSSPNAAERQGQVEELHHFLQLANELGAPFVRVFGGNVQPGCTLDQTVQWVAESLARAMPLAEAYGVTVLLETHDAFCRGAEVARVLQQVDDKRLQAIWDVHHPFRMGESIEETWRWIGADTAHVHIKDARLRPDGSWQLVLLGAGEVPVRAVVELLHRNGYGGYLSVEWEKKWHPEIEEPEVALPQHANVLQQWFDEIRVRHG